MARYRTVKPELFADEKLNECSVDARFCFIGLLPFVDDMGRRQYHPKRVKAEVFPTDDDVTWQVVDALVQELAKVGVIELYDVGKQRCLRIPHFLRHQYVKKPGHCYVPPSPTEGPKAERCRCANCRAKANGDVFLQEHPHQYGTDTPPEEYEYHTGTVPVPEEYTPEGKGREGNSKGKGVNTYTQEANQNFAAQTPTPETLAENRRAEIAALDKIARAILALLELEANSNLLTELSESIRLKARAKSCSIEAAAQQISGKAAFLNAGSPPEDWSLWFADVRYDYVPQGDTRLQGRNVSARPTCGGSLCTDGWEIVNVQGEPRLRRCPDCAKLW